MSNNLKAWQTRRQNEEKKGFLKLFIIAWLIAGVIYVAIPNFTAEALSSDITIKQQVLPINKDKKELKLWNKIDLLIIENQAQNMSQEIKCTLWEESIKIFGESGEVAYNAYGNNPAGSLDRGVAMFNNYWRADVSDECAFDLSCALTQMIKDFKKGKQKQWYGWRTCKENNFKY